MDKAEPTINKVAAEPIAPTKPSPGAKRHVELTVGGMTCTHCPPALEKTLRAIDGVASAHVNLANKLAAVDYDPGRVAAIDLAKEIRAAGYAPGVATTRRSEEHTSELQSLMRISYAVFCLKNITTEHMNTDTSTV